MKAIINGLDLNNAIVRVSRALPTRDASNIIECIKVIARDDKMILFATDKELSIEETIEANVVLSGTFLVPGKIFGEYIRNIAGESEISLELDEDYKLNVSSANSECSISCNDVSLYPDIDTVADDNKFMVTECNFKDIINKVAFSVATDDTRPIYKGINVVAKEYALTAVATDGYRIAMCKKPLETKVEHIQATVPSRSMNELSRLLGDSEELVTVCMETNNMLVKCGNTVLMTRLLTNGQYINYETIIPTDIVATLLVDKEVLEKSLHTASIMSRSERGNLINLNIEEYKMKMSSSSEYGTAREEISISLSGKDIRCSYNAKYIQDCLKVLTAETVKLEFATRNGCIITIDNSDEVLYLVLPVKS